MSYDRWVSTNATDLELEIEDGGHETTWLGEEREQETSIGDDSFCIVVVGCRAVVVVAGAIRVDPGEDTVSEGK